MAEIDKLVNQWLDIDINPKTRDEIKLLHQNGDCDALKAKLSTRIAFGTAGLRSSMEAGFAHMNDVTVLQAAQGLVAYLKVNGGKSIVLGYDHRFNSQRYAELTASVAVLQGLEVLYLGTMDLSEESYDLSATKVAKKISSDRLYVHTPLVPFAIDHYKASAGVMVTASHNPANDNGYKVYYGNGCQIIPPFDHDIASSIDQNLQPWDGAWDVVGNLQTYLHLVKCVKPEITQAYIAAMKLIVQVKDLGFEFVYTPMHGIGQEIFDKVLTLFTNVKAIPVPEQQHPDPKFPTVSFPNPEEKGALDLAVETAERNNVSLVVANDPDADRFSVAVKVDGKWQQLTGNEIGFLFGQYVIEKTPQDQLKDTYLVCSTVSSQIFSVMAEKEGFHFQDTLTGFKWIGNKSIDLQNAGYKVPFGYEEAIGYMFGLVNDKDGISAAVMWLQLYSSWFRNLGITPVDKLIQGYEKYGYSKEHNGYYKLDDLSKTAKIFAEIRNSFEGDKPESVGQFKVTYWRDLTLGYESSTEDFKSILPLDPSSQMITAVFTHNKDTVRFTCRGSGTEPKLKVYIEGKSPDEANAKWLAEQCWETLKQEWFKPKKNGLKEVTNQ